MRVIKIESMESDEPPIFIQALVVTWTWISAPSLIAKQKKRAESRLPARVSVKTTLVGL